MIDTQPPDHRHRQAKDDHILDETDRADGDEKRRRIPTPAPGDRLVVEIRRWHALQRIADEGGYHPAEREHEQTKTDVGESRDAEKAHVEQDDGAFDHEHCYRPDLDYHTTPFRLGDTVKKKKEG